MELALLRSSYNDAGVSHLPSRSMPIGTTSNASGSSASATLRAEMIEISCSADLPPKSKPTRSFFAIALTIPACAKNESAAHCGVSSHLRMLCVRYGHEADREKSGGI